MSHNHRKRKHRPTYQHEATNPRASSPQEFKFLSHHEGFQSRDAGPTMSKEVDPLQALCIQAHEADIVYGPNTKVMAQSLEVGEYRTTVGALGAVELVSRIGSALIQWGDGPSASYPTTGNDDEDIPEAKQRTGSSMWIDRTCINDMMLSGLPLSRTNAVALSPAKYDARLLLDSIPSIQKDNGPPASPSGWSDVASDAEDTFFFTPAEAEDYHREKRRRLLEQTREERLKARMQEDGVEEEPGEEDVWGDSDEEPDDTQTELMGRTAAHLLSSPNPAQLEMRILANHGRDRRFSFLRGRWKRAWNLAKAKARIKKSKDEDDKERGGPAALGILAGYGSDNDSDTGEETTKNNEAGKASVATTTPNLQDKVTPPPKGNGDEDSAKEMRRQRLKEWAEKRRAGKEASR